MTAAGTRCFRVDRSAALSAGDVIERLPVPDLNSARQTGFARHLFPDGVSGWGMAMALDEATPIAVTLEALANNGLRQPTQDGFLCSHDGARTLRASKDRLIELIAELVRRGTFPPPILARPSAGTARSRQPARAPGGAVGRMSASLWSGLTPGGFDPRPGQWLAERALIGLGSQFIPSRRDRARP